LTEVHLVQGSAKRPIAESADAISRANVMLGVLVPQGADSISAVLKTVTDDNTHYLSDRIIGKPFWHITYHDLPIQLKSAPGFVRDPYHRTWDALLDPQSGVMVTIRSRWPENEALPSPEPTASVAAARMSSGSGEVYRSFPSDAPSISFWDALESLERGGVDVVTPKQVIGLYVIRATDFKPAKAVWVVTLRGLPPLKSSMGPLDAECDYTCIVDSTTGVFEWLSGTCPKKDTPDTKEQGGK